MFHSEFHVGSCTRNRVVKLEISSLAHFEEMSLCCCNIANIVSIWYMTIVLFVHLSRSWLIVSCVHCCLQGQLCDPRMLF